MKLDKIYINEAVRIRTEYFKSLEKIIKEEKPLLEKKEKIDEIKDKMEKTVYDNDMNDITKRLKLNNDLMNIEKFIKEIQNKIRPHYEHIEKLRTDADKLYTAIKEKYPNIKENEIKKQIAPYLKFENV